MEAEENCILTARVVMFQRKVNISLIDDGSSLCLDIDVDGCYKDTEARELPYLAYEGDALTPSLCKNACREEGYFYAGLQGGNQCWCGHKAPSEQADQSECNIGCSGDSSKMCGGTMRMNVRKACNVPVL